MKQRFLLTSVICMMASPLSDVMATHVFNISIGSTLRLTQDYSNAIVGKNYGTIIFSGNAKLGGGTGGQGIALINGSQSELIDDEPINSSVVIDKDTAVIKGADEKEIENIPSLENLSGSTTQLAGFVGRVNNYAKYFYAGGNIRSLSQKSDESLDATNASLHVLNDTVLTLKMGDCINAGTVNLGYTDANLPEDNNNGKMVINGGKNADGSIVAITDIENISLETGDNAATLNILNDQYLETDPNTGTPIEDSWTGSVLEINSGKVILDGGSKKDRVDWTGDIYLKGGELTLRNIVDDSAVEANGARKDSNGNVLANKGGELIATGGTLILDDHVVLNEEDKISPEVKLVSKKGASFGKGASVVLGSDDTITGEIAITGGELISQGFATDANTYVTVTEGGLNVRNGENKNDPGFVMNNEKDLIAGDCTTKIEAPIVVNNGTFHLNDMVDSTSEQENVDSIDSELTINGGQFVGKSILIESNDTRMFNQTGGTTYLTDSILSLNAGSKISGAKLIHDAVDIENTDQNSDSQNQENNENIPVLLGQEEANKKTALRINTLTMLQAPVRRINAAKALGKTITAKDVKEGDTQITLSNGEDNDATLIVPEKENGGFEFVVQGSSEVQVVPENENNENEVNKPLLVSGLKNNKKLGDETSSTKATTFTLNKDSKVERGKLVIGDGTNNNKLILTDNATIGKATTINIKKNAELNINGSESEVTIDFNNENNTIDGAVNLNDGTLTLVGDLSKVFSKEEKKNLASTKKNGLLLHDQKLKDDSEENEDSEHNESSEHNEGEEEEDDNNESEQGKEFDYKLLGENYNIGGNIINLYGTGKGQVNNENKIDSKTISISKNFELMIDEEGASGQIKNGGKLAISNANVKGIEPDINSKTGEENIGHTKIVRKDDTPSTLTTGNLIQKSLESKADDTVNINNNGWVVLTEQSENVNANINFNSGTSVLSTNAQEINGVVTIGKEGNPSIVYFTSGQIGGIEIAKGSAIKITKGNDTEIQGKYMDKLAKDADGGILKIKLEDEGKVNGDIYQYTGKVEISCPGLHFGSIPTLGNTSATFPYYKQYGGGLIIDGVTVTFDDATVLFGDPEFRNDGKCVIGESSISEEESIFSGTTNTINGLYEEHAKSNTIKIGKDNSTQADFAIDVYGRSKESAKFDTFGKTDGTTIMSPANGNTATVNIVDFALNGDLFGNDAPIDENIPMKIFNVSSSNGITFTSSGTQKLTAVGYYALKSAGNGTYNLELTKYNPGVFRDQIGITALNQNQATLNDDIFGHILANSNTKSLDYLQGKTPGKNKNLWVKIFGGHEKLHLNTGTQTNENKENTNTENNTDNELPDITNNSYGALLGFDFSTKFLSNRWAFTPSIFAAYMGANQKYELTNEGQKFKSRQDGGELGLAGAFSNGNFAIGTMIYGGYYRNKITLPNVGENSSNSNDNNDKDSDGQSEKINHGLFGGSMRAGYNIKVSKNVVIQPNFSATYNYISGSEWNTTYGSMDMVSEKLNGFSLLPGIDLIFSGNQTSICISAKYVLNMDKNGTGKAGNIELPQLKMKKKGYMQYGLGVSFISKRNLVASLQATFRNLGRSGFGGQLNISWKF